MNRKNFLCSAGAAVGSLAINPLSSLSGTDNYQSLKKLSNFIEMNKINRTHKEGNVPLVAVKGTAYECGIQLGETWRNIIKARVNISSITQKGKPWWSGEDKTITKLLDKYAPHLPDVMRGMQKGAGMGDKPPLIWDWPSGSGNFKYNDGCTAFSIKSTATVDGVPISGQTKDTPGDRIEKYQILKLQPSDGPSFLTLTYPGELFGHGFATTGVSLFRNALYYPDSASGLPFNVWGLVALCSNIDSAIECALSYGVKHSGNALLSDGNGRSVSVECITDEIGLVETQYDVHLHTNHVLEPKLMHLENKKNPGFASSKSRYKRAKKLMENEIGKISPTRCIQLLSDHENFPLSICRHDDNGLETTSAVIVEPTLGKLHVTRGNPCMNWPVTYSL